MTWSKDVRKGDIWFAYVYFLDKPDVGKVRPVLVVDVEDTAKAIALKITSQSSLDSSISIEIEKWEECGLKKPSLIRIDQIFQIPEKDFLGEERLGCVTEELLSRVESIIDENA